jgi:hypothetical protein
VKRKGERVAKDTGQTNEGEGNSTAARSYDKAQRRFVISGSLDEKAREAESELDGPEAQELTQTEASGLRRMAKEDPAVHRNYHEKVKDHAYVIWERAGRPRERERGRAESEIAKPQPR